MHYHQDFVALHAHKLLVMVPASCLRAVASHLDNKCKSISRGNPRKKSNVAVLDKNILSCILICFPLSRQMLSVSPSLTHCNAEPPLILKAMFRICIRRSYVYKVRISPTLNGSSVLQHIKHVVIHLSMEFMTGYCSISIQDCHKYTFIVGSDSHMKKQERVWLSQIGAYRSRNFWN